ncbi:MAG: hypothetical protein KF901_00155 [Myxococcales bacterium]|nr:hypothetical protein [Myxococcales bacterium]
MKRRSWRWTALLAVCVATPLSSQAQAPESAEVATDQHVADADAAAPAEQPTELQPTEAQPTELQPTEAHSTEAHSTEAHSTEPTEAPSADLQPETEPAPRSDTARLGRPRRPPQATDDELAGASRTRDPDDTPWFPVGPGWSPIVSIGYLLVSAVPSDGPRPFTREEYEQGVSHALTTSALFPLLATGDRDSAWRLALTVGGGFDYVRLPAQPGTTFSEDDVTTEDGGRFEIERPSSRRSQYLLYAAIGATLRFRRGSQGALFSAHWVPAREWGPVFGTRLDRVRLSIGWTVGWAHVALVVGRTRESVYNSWGLRDLRARAHVGLTVGSGW